MVRYAPDLFVCIVIICIVVCVLTNGCILFMVGYLPDLLCVLVLLLAGCVPCLCVYGLVLVIEFMVAYRLWSGTYLTFCVYGRCCFWPGVYLAFLCVWFGAAY